MKALAFDLFGTLVDLVGLEAPASKVTKAPKEFVATWRSTQREYTFLLSAMGRYLPFSVVTARALEATCKAERIELRPDLRDVLLREWRQLPPFPDVAPTMRSLAGRVPAAVLTNAESGLAAHALKSAGLASMFADVLSAEEVRTFKPSPRVYRLAAMRLHLDPKEIGLVSANPFDVMGAKAAGLRAIWVNRTKAAFEPLDVKPDAEIEDLSALPSRL